LDILASMGAGVVVEPGEEQGGEPIGTLRVDYTDMRGAEVHGEVIGRAIDEFPVLMVAATQSEGTMDVHDAAELRVKETDRIAVMAAELRKMGAKIEERPDGFIIEGPQKLHGARVNAHDDHRIAMSLAVAGLIAEGETVVEGAGAAADSFPGFAAIFRSLGADMVQAS
jgi:3-phosphoshikimate 1-carboxyvinyltransferase